MIKIHLTVQQPSRMTPSIIVDTTRVKHPYRTGENQTRQFTEKLEAGQAQAMFFVDVASLFSF
jgi:hypothetical protein